MPITRANLHAAMSYHTLNENQQAAYARIQDAAIVFCDVVLQVLPEDSTDAQDALQLIFLAKATANRGVAVRGTV